MNQQVKFLLDTSKLSTRAFSEAIVEGHTNTQNCVGARSAEPRADYLAKALTHFSSINAQGLITGIDDPFLGNGPASQSTTTHKNKGGIQNNSGSHNTVTNNVTLEKCQRDLVAAQKENEMLEEQLTGKDALLAAKEEMLTLLRGGHNRPN